MKFRSPTPKPVYLALLSGHTLVIGPDLIEVPLAFRRMAIAEGCVLEGMEPEAKPSEASITKMDLIKEAMRKMMADDVPNEFTKHGRPDVKALTKRVGFDVASSERDAAWQAVADDAKDDDDDA